MSRSKSKCISKEYAVDLAVGLVIHVLGLKETDADMDAILTVADDGYAKKMIRILAEWYFDVDDDFDDDELLEGEADGKANN